MIQLYVSIIFTGIMLILISLGMIAYDRKKAFDYSTKLENKKDELEVVISDADQIITEMNKFSDYIVTQMEIKNEEMHKNLKLFDEKLLHINTTISESSFEGVIVQQGVVNSSNFERNNDFNHSTSNHKKNEEVQSNNLVGTTVHKIHSKVKEKVVPINNKYHQIQQLSQKGLSETEIAKKLNMGKGEVQLFLGMNK